MRPVKSVVAHAEVRGVAEKRRRTLCPAQIPRGASRSGAMKRKRWNGASAERPDVQELVAHRGQVAIAVVRGARAALWPAPRVEAA